MGLTPIRIRGKRKRSLPQPSSDLWRADSVQSTPPTSSASSSLKAQKMRRSLAAVLETRATRRRVTLESLPSELLETILLYSANLALPRASPLLGAKLSGRATLVRLFIWAFHDTWNQWFGIPKNPSILFGPEREYPSFVVCDGDPVFQSSVLELPWVDMDLILQAQQTWAGTYARDRYYQHSLFVSNCNPPKKDASHETTHDIKGGFGHFNARDCFEADYQEVHRWWPFEGTIYSWGSYDVHPLTRIPSKLITGPWDDEAQRRLVWLIRGGVSIKSEDLLGYQRPPAWEDRIECIRNAVVDCPEPNNVVINCLMHHWMFEGLPRDHMRRELAKLDRRLEWGDDTVNAKEVLRQVKHSLEYWLDVSLLSDEAK